MHYTVTIAASAETLSMIPKEVFVAHVVKAPKRWRCITWKAVRDTPEEALNHLVEAIRNAYPKYGLTFTHTEE